MAIEGILDQIKSDDGVPGARGRKQAQRAKDVNPSGKRAKVSSAGVEVPVEFDEDFDQDDFDEGLLDEEL